MDVSIFCFLEKIECLSLKLGFLSFKCFKDLPEELKELGFENFKSQIVHQHRYNYLYDQEYLGRYIDDPKIYSSKLYEPCAQSREEFNISGSQPNSYSHSSINKRHKATARYSKEVVKTLNEAFDRLDDGFGYIRSPKEIEILANKTGLNNNQISKWFSNKRFYLRKKNR